MCLAVGQSASDDYSQVLTDAHFKGSQEPPKKGPGQHFRFLAGIRQPALAAIGIRSRHQPRETACPGYAGSVFGILLRAFL